MANQVVVELVEGYLMVNHDLRVRWMKLDQILKQHVNALAGVMQSRPVVIERSAIVVKGSACARVYELVCAECEHCWSFARALTREWKQS